MNKSRNLPEVVATNTLPFQGQRSNAAGGQLADVLHDVRRGHRGWAGAHALRGNVDEALDAIMGDPAKAHYDVAKINRMFFMPEHVDMETAMAAVKKPR